jgi:hypothetical protein
MQMIPSTPFRARNFSANNRTYFDLEFDAGYLLHKSRK